MNDSETKTPRPPKKTLDDLATEVGRHNETRELIKRAYCSFGVTPLSIARALKLPYRKVMDIVKELDNETNRLSRVMRRNDVRAALVPELYAVFQQATALYDAAMAGTQEEDIFMDADGKVLSRRIRKHGSMLREASAAIKNQKDIMDSIASIMGVFGQSASPGDELDDMSPDELDALAANGKKDVPQ